MTTRSALASALMREYTRTKIANGNAADGMVLLSVMAIKSELFGIGKTRVENGSRGWESRMGVGNESRE